ncbi:MAG: CHAT domain-containing protein, partial [Candidatus Promineifilaceae bacterium]
GPHRFPRPDPAGAADLPAAGEPHFELCCGSDAGPIVERYTRIVQRQPRGAEKDVSLFGRYLFDSLIGPAIWADILALAAGQAADVLELALAWPFDENDLHRLNWELLHDGRGFLAARRPDAPREVAVTRLVSGSAGVPEVMAPVPRCLFAIGADLTDSRIRPGAEYLGLLRQIERDGRTVHTRLLRRATPTAIERLVASFQPHLVHFICHGEFDGRGGAKLELAPDENDAGGERLRDVEALFTYLSAGPRLPSLVVLSACNTGQASQAVEMAGGHVTAPLAAALVNKGIPVVVGMAGRVADSACRHFTRRFGEAIVRGEPLVAAAAQGRRAAFAYDQSPEESVDWAFPALFLAESVPAGYTPSLARQDPGAPPVETWVNNFNIKRPPAFYGRIEFYEAYYRLFEPNQPSVIAAFVERNQPGHGKSRLLQELIAQAVRDGHLPVALIHPDNPNLPYPENLEGLRKALIDALNQTAAIYGLGGQVWQLYHLAAGPAGAVEGANPELSPEVRLELLNNQGRLSGRALALALRADLGRLLAQARAAHPFIAASAGRALLFLDDVHLFGPEFLQDWFGGRALGSYGLGQDEAGLTPAVMSLSLTGPAAQIVQPTREFAIATPWLALLPLRPFPREDDQDLMACERVLLNPFDAQGRLKPGVSNLPFALNYGLKRDDEASWNNWSEGFRDVLGGMPINFVSQAFYGLVKLALAGRFVLPADDEIRLQKYMQADNGGP